MTASINILSIASDLATHTYKRQSLIAANIANADTPGYKAKDIKGFEALVERPFAMRANRPGHQMSSTISKHAEISMITSPGARSPNGNNVSIEDQMVRSADIKQQHDLALGVYKKSMTILRATLGRR